MDTNSSNARRLRIRLWLMMVCAFIVVFANARLTNGQKKGCPRGCNIGIDDIHWLDDKLQTFVGQLPPPELAAMNQLLLRAASAAADNSTGVNVKASFFDIRGPILADENGDRGGGRPPGQGRVSNPGLGSVLAQDREPNRPPPPPPPDSMAALNGALGVSQVRDPGGPPPAVVNGFAGKLQAFGGTLTLKEKAVMNWLLDRAARSGPGTLRGGGPSPTLSQALGIAAFGSRAAGGGNTWLLSFN